jgi:phosphatidate cytidylyltransferase
MLTPLSMQAYWFSAATAAIALIWVLTTDSVIEQVIVIFIATLLQRLYFHTFDTFGTLVSLGIMIGALLLIYLRTQVGITATLWIIGLVVITDIAGYFVGRIVGGVKFWPAFSPKKTWSGIVGGWFGAALFTYFMVQGGHISLPTETALFVALCLSFASQLGDITESALKRASGVKDSSNLIPGHGGVMDRFDGLIGASLIYAAMLGLMAWA